jgi:hypothetical protein
LCNGQLLRVADDGLGLVGVGPVFENAVIENREAPIAPNIPTRMITVINSTIVKPATRRGTKAEVCTVSAGGHQTAVIGNWSRWR